MMTPKISIIVPIYRAENSIYRCVDSILTQDEEDFELILVDDGSPDRCGEICDEYGAQNCRVKVIHQANAGVAAARNAGIHAAVGRYLGFVDSDDWVEPCMFSRMLEVAKEAEADIVMCDSTIFYPSDKSLMTTIMQLSGNRILEKNDFTPSLLLEMAGPVWRCIYKNDENSKGQRIYPLAFPLDLTFSEDRVFNLYAFAQANKVAYIKESLYNYGANAKSTVHCFHADYFEEYKKGLSEIDNAIYDVWENDKDIKKAFARHDIFAGALGAVCNYYHKTSPMTKAQRRDAVKKLYKDEQLQSTIAQAERLSIRERLLTGGGRKAPLLITYARLANLKHDRELKFKAKADC